MNPTGPLLKELKSKGAWLFDEFGLAIADLQYRPESFGHEHVTLASSEIHLRISFDAKDSHVTTEVSLPSAPEERWHFERISTELGSPLSTDGKLDTSLANLRTHLRSVIDGLHSRPLDSLPLAWNEEAHAAKIVESANAKREGVRQATELTDKRSRQLVTILPYLAAPLLCLAVFWRAPFVWFRIDDFAWLNLSNLPLTEALFEPFAQGTIRVFSERLYFLSLTELFGLTAWPFRAVTLGVWFVNLALIQLIGEKLTGSRAAGLLASLLWTISPVLVTPLVWASAFNEVLIAFIFLAAFYARLRGWRISEAVLFLCGFGVLEIIVVYPALVLVHALLTKRAWRTSLWMFVPAIAFGLAHLFLIPKTDAPVYRMIVDVRLAATLGQYLQWTAPIPVFLALAAFAAWKLRAGDRLPLFCFAWFLLPLAPVLPLANHITDYYLTTPGIGLAWLAGWGLAEAWRTGWLLRVPAVALAAYYAWVSIPETTAATEWNQRLSAEIRFAVRAVEATAAKYPGTAVAVTGMDEEAALHCTPHHCFEVAGASRSWLLPGPEAEVLREVQAGRARVIDVTPPQAHDVTRLWSTLNAAASNTRRE